MFAYCAKALRIGRSRPCSETESGTLAGQPTAPRKIASKPRRVSIPSAGIIAPVARQVSQDQSKRVTSSRAPLAAATARAASVTGTPIPSPGIAAMRWVFMRLPLGCRSARSWSGG